MDINAVIQDEFDRMSKDGEIEAAIRKKANEVITSSIDEAFRSYGKIGKQIEKSVENALDLDFSKVTLDEYNVMICQMVSHAALEHLETKAKAKINERLASLLKPAPKEITVQGIVDMFIEEQKEDGCLCSDSAYIEIETQSWSDTSTSIKIFKEKPAGTYSSKVPDLEFFVSNNKILIPRINATRWPTETGYGLEAAIYQMFCSGTVITDAHEVDAYDISLSYYDY